MTAQGSAAEPSTLDILLYTVFDYAGMYPPASLDFPTMLAEAAAFEQTLARPHLVGAHLVLSGTHLGKITPALLQDAGFTERRRVMVALLGKPIGNRIDFLTEERLEELSQLRQLNAVGLTSSPRTQITSYECALAGDLREQEGSLNIGLRNIKTYLQEEDLVLCLEPDLSGEEWRGNLAAVIHAAGDLNRHLRGPAVILKVRCGGERGIGADRLAAVIHTCAVHGAGLKATQGLHHPIVERERFQNSIGFLGLSCAVMLSRAELDRFSEAEILACLTASSIEQFRFGRVLGFENFEIDREELIRVKNLAPFNIGSCSLAEPDADLVRLLGNI